MPRAPAPFVALVALATLGAEAANPSLRGPCGATRAPCRFASEAEQVKQDEADTWAVREVGVWAAKAFKAMGFEPRDGAAEAETEQVRKVEEDTRAMWEAGVEAAGAFKAWGEKSRALEEELGKLASPAAAVELGKRASVAAAALAAPAASHVPPTTQVLRVSAIASRVKARQAPEKGTPEEEREKALYEAKQRAAASQQKVENDAEKVRDKVTQAGKAQAAAKKNAEDVEQQLKNLKATMAKEEAKLKAEQKAAEKAGDIAALDRIEALRGKLYEQLDKLKAETAQAAAKEESTQKTYDDLQALEGRMQKILEKLEDEAYEKSYEP